jgi:hypothetical protein
MLAPAAFGQTRDEYGEVVQQTVGRISYLVGQVSFSRGDDPDNWQPADRNVPMTLGDRVYTGSRSRLELQVHGGAYVRLAAKSELAALNLTEETKQFSVQIGVASFQIRRLGEEETFEVDTPNAAVTFERPGEYRVEVDERGNTRIAVRRGAATAAAGGGQIPLNAGEMIEVEGIDAPRYGIVALGPPDGWDQWVNTREGRVDRARSYRYVSADIVGVDDLDEYGRWEEVPQYGWCWTPTQIAVDWVPYRVGHWIWQDPWGWTWVSAEPWGWAPYHYGRWAFARSRWYWVPVAPSVSVVAYSPALVGFVGGGPGWSASISFGGGGVVGWFPLAPRDPLVPWWGSRASIRTSVTNVTYVNKTYVTVVNQSTFVSGGIVTNNIVRDRAVVSQVAAAPVVGGAIPVVPTRASLHVAARQDVAAAAPPPAAIASRAVVARVAPPPAPPTFQAKAAVIQENRGAPVAPAVAARMSVENRGRPQSIAPVRPVAEQSGRVTLQPKAETPQTAGRRPEPVTAFRGRPMATADKPVASAPVTGPTGPAGAPSREVRPRESAPPAAGQPPAPAPPSREVRPRESRPPEAAQPPAEKQRQVAPAPQAAPAQPAQRGRPQGEEWRMRPTQPPASPETIQRGRVAPQAPPQEKAPPPGIERRREQPTQPPQQPPPAREERGRVAPPQQQQQQQAPPQQNAPPPRVERRREQPTQPPQQQAPPREERRAAPQPPPQQQQQQRQAAPPPPQPQGERPQVQRGERPTPQKGQEKKDQQEKKKDEQKKDER